MAYQELQVYLVSQESRDMKDHVVSLDLKEKKEQGVSQGVPDNVVFQVHEDPLEILV